MNNFQRNLKELRTSSKLTQVDLADQIHETPQVISNWERGYTVPDLNNLITLADYFNISIDELVGIKRIVSKELLDKIKLLEDVTKDIKDSLGYF